MSTNADMPLREIVARVLCENGGSWTTSIVFSDSPTPRQRELADSYRERADRILARILPTKAER